MFKKFPELIENADPCGRGRVQKRQDPVDGV